MHSPCRFVWLTCVVTLAAIAAQAAVGDPLPNLKPQESKLFNNGKAQFSRVWGLKEGLGPVYADASCSRCHNVPTLGGSSTRHWTFFGRLNPDGTFDPLMAPVPRERTKAESCCSLAPLCRSCGTAPKAERKSLPTPTL